MREHVCDGRSLAIPWVPVAAGRLALTHRPRKSELLGLAAAGCTHLATLLSEHEGAREVGHLAAQGGAEWLWLPLAGARLPAPAEEDRLLAGIRRMASAVESGGSLVLHCAAGLHRTGMIAHALLLSLGLDGQASREAIGRARPATLDGVGEERLAWAARLIHDEGRRCP